MTDENQEDLEAKLEQLRVTLAEREASIPAHSIRPHQLIQIEELEDEIAALETQLKPD